MFQVSLETATSEKVKEMEGFRARFTWNLLTWRT